MVIALSIRNAVIAAFNRGLSPQEIAIQLGVSIALIDEVVRTRNSINRSAHQLVNTGIQSATAIVQDILVRDSGGQTVPEIAQATGQTVETVNEVLDQQPEDSPPGDISAQQVIPPEQIPASGGGGGETVEGGQQDDAP